MSDDETSVDVAKLRQKRGVVKALVTRMEKWTFEHGHDASFAEIEVKLKQLRKYETQFDSVQDDIEDADDTEFEQEERAEFEEKLGVLEAKLLEYKEDHAHHTVLNETAGGANITVDLSSADLPKLELPKFSGEYLDFPQFFDTFMNVVHNCKGKNMTDLRRFALLKSCLEGRALDAIKNLPLTSGNYKAALDILTERFMKKRLIFESNIKRIWELNKATNTVSLRQLCDDYISLYTGLTLVATEPQCANGLLIQLLLTKCDKDTIKKWEELSADKDNLASIGDFINFLRKRCTQLESVEYALQSSASMTHKSVDRFSSSTSRRSNTAASSIITCPSCKGSHDLEQCPKLKQLDPEQRYATVKQLKRCISCLIAPSPHSNCTARCSTCKKMHHALLHFGKATPNGSPNSPNRTSDSILSASSLIITSHQQEGKVFTGNPHTSPKNPYLSSDSYTFLATAKVKVQTNNGNYVILRALLDGASQLNLITEHARQLLGIDALNTKSEIKLRGINESSSILRQRIVINVKSMYSDFTDSVVLMVHPNMRQCHPTQHIDVSKWGIPTDAQLADTEFNIPHQVDLILNAHLSHWYLLPRQFSLGVGKPLLRETHLGWVVVGDVICYKTYDTLSCSCTQNKPKLISQTESSLTATMQKFWEIENHTEKTLLNAMGNSVEEYFKTTYRRLESGRFMLRLPFCRSSELLGVSLSTALKRFISIEKKLTYQPDQCRQYTEFMDKYIALGQFTNLNSTITQTRVVFDASCPTDSHDSLNDLVMVGPKIQPDAVAPLIKFGCNRFALTVDISKMYRQLRLQIGISKLFDPLGSIQPVVVRANIFM